MSFLSKKTPKIEHLTPLYAVIVFFVYTWSAIQFFWRIPSWLKFSSIGEIAVMYSYVIVVNLLESLSILLLVVIVFLLLPIKWGYDQYVVKSTLAVATALGLLAYWDYNVYPEKVFYELPVYNGMFFCAIEALILLIPINKIPFLYGMLESLAERFVIFLYITIPISVASLVVVIVRNLF